MSAASVVIMFVMLGACNSGSGSTTLTAAVTSGNCIGMTTGSTCQIQLTYVNNSATNLTLGYSSSTGNPTAVLPVGYTLNPSFTSGVQSCQASINSSLSTQQKVCPPITIVYTSGSPNAGNSLNFYLCSSNPCTESTVVASSTPPLPIGGN